MTRGYFFRIRVPFGVKIEIAIIRPIRIPARSKRISEYLAFLPGTKYWCNSSLIEYSREINMVQ